VLGNDQNGDLGDSSTTNSPVPVQVSGLTSGVTSLSAEGSPCATVACGVQCWGFNGAGQLGDGVTSAFPGPSVPVAVHLLGASTCP